MMNNNYNSDFFSYYGKINRKNYIINLLILSALFLLLSITDFTIFTKFSSEILTTTVFSILDFSLENLDCELFISYLQNTFL